MGPKRGQVGAKASAGDRRIRRWVTVADDQIYERYQAKAIDEINALGHDIAEWLGERHPGAAPVLGTGHPLADILLVKHRPMPAEVQEGVAFFGRAGQAILKSLQRLRIDPLMLYGTACLKAAIEPDGDDLEQARAWLTRELHITQPRVVVTLGDDARAFLDSLSFPLASVALIVGTAASTTPRPSRRSGTRSRCSAPGTRTCRRTDGRGDCPRFLGTVPGSWGLSPVFAVNTRCRAPVIHPGDTAAMAERHIVAMGGGGFLMERGSLLDDYVLALAGVAEPRVCYLGTAMGDEPGNIATFHRAFPPGRARATHLSLFQRDAADPRDHLLARTRSTSAAGTPSTCWRSGGRTASTRRSAMRGTPASSCAG